MAGRPPRPLPLAASAQRARSMGVESAVSSNPQGSASAAGRWLATVAFALDACDAWEYSGERLSPEARQSERRHGPCLLVCRDLNSQGGEPVSEEAAV